MKKLGTAAFAALALGLTATFGLGTAAAQGGPAFVKVDSVKREPLSQTVAVVGRLVARQSGTVASRSAGLVEKVLVEVGDRVTQGQVLVLLDASTLSAQVDLRQAELRRAQQELNRMERLKQRRSAAFPRARYETAIEDVAKARAQLKVAQIELNHAKIRAPYPGVVTERYSAAGSYLKVGDRVVNMVNDRALEIEADVPTNRIAGLTPGVRVSFQIEGLANREYKAKVRAVVPVDDPLARTRAVRFLPEFPKGKNGYAVNQSVTVDVPIGARRLVVSVHKDGIVHKGGRTMVFVVTDGKAMIRPVLLGEAVGNRFEVKRGVRPGEIVVVRGNERLRPGQPVRYRVNQSTRGGRAG